MEITFAPDAKHKSLAPQFKWTEEFQDYKVCQVAGIEMTAIKESDTKSTYELWYSGYRLAGLPSMEIAQNTAPEFARSVLKLMIESVQE